MKKHGIVGAVALAVCLGLVVPSASGADPSEDSVTGAGLVTGRSINLFVLNARSGPRGGEPRGIGHFLDFTDKDGTAKGASFSGPITCLRVDGNRAVLVIEFRHVRKQPGPRTAVMVFVQDNGTLPGVESPDRIAVVDLLHSRPCPDPLSRTPAGKVDRGDIRIEDAQP